MKKEEKGMTYAGTGVVYSDMDWFKRLAQKAAQETAGNITRFGFNEVAMSRGESVYVIDAGDFFLGLVEEGLGTKCLVADEMYKLTEKSYYDHIAQCTVAMIVNDMITLGMLPISTAMHLGLAASDWVKDKKRSKDLIRGWKKACNLAVCTWGPGETPTLKGIITPGTVVLSGSAFGIIRPKEKMIKCNIQDGDIIIIFLSSGIHANGLTLAREIAAKLPKGYLTVLADGRTYGESLLDPTIIYVKVIEACLNAGIDIHYAVNITGHGWRKLMRSSEPFVYIIEKVPKPQPVFDLIQEMGPVDNIESYGNLNMGAGFAIYVPKKDVSKVISEAKKCKIIAMEAGHIEKRGGDKRVIILPKGIEFAGSTLEVR